MSVVAELLEHYGAGVTEEEVADVLREVLETAGRPSSTGMSPVDADFLARHADVGDLDSGEATDNGVIIERTRAELARVVRAWSTRELAERWGVDQSRVRHRCSEGALYATRTGRSLTLPAWQFDSGLRPLPGLAAVLAAIPEGLHPLEVEGWMTTPNGNLVVGDHPLSVRDWLLGGGDTRAVVELARTIDRW